MNQSELGTIGHATDFAWIYRPPVAGGDLPSVAPPESLRSLIQDALPALLRVNEPQLRLIEATNQVPADELQVHVRRITSGVSISEGDAGHILGAVVGFLATPGLLKSVLDTRLLALVNTAAGDRGVLLLFRWLSRLHSDHPTTFPAVHDVVRRWSARMSDIQGRAAVTTRPSPEPSSDADIWFIRSTRWRLSAYAELAEAVYRPYVDFLHEVCVAAALRSTETKAFRLAETFGQRARAIDLLLQNQHAEYRDLVDLRPHTIRNMVDHQAFRLDDGRHQVVVLDLKHGTETSRIETTALVAAYVDMSTRCLVSWPTTHDIVNMRVLSNAIKAAPKQ